MCGCFSFFYHYVANDMLTISKKQHDYIVVVVIWNAYIEHCRHEHENKRQIEKLLPLRINVKFYK